MVCPPPLVTLERLLTLLKPARADHDSSPPTPFRPSTAVAHHHILKTHHLVRDPHSVPGDHRS